MEAIMADINDLVKEFWSTSRDGTVGASLVAMHRLFEILQRCFVSFEVCFHIIPVFLTAIHLADKNIQRMANPSQAVLIRTKLKLLIDGHRKMLDHHFLNAKIWAIWATRSNSYLVS